MGEYQQHHSLWNLIIEYIPESELAEIRTIIGEAIIDCYTDLYAEVQMWGRIWRESLSAQQGGRPRTTASPLADPPAIKALLKAEIQLLLQSVRDRAAKEGRDGDAALSRFSPSVVHYALGSSSGSPRGSVENRDTPSRSRSRQSQDGSRSSSRVSSASSLEDEIEAMKTKLSVCHVEEVVFHLRSLLMEDCEALKKEVQFLQECVEHAHYTQAVEELPEPTVAELREQRRAIQMDLQREALTSSSPVSPDKPAPAPATATAAAASLGPLARSRQKMERQCRTRDFQLCTKPPPPISPGALPRPPTSLNRHRWKSADQLTVPHRDRTPSASPSPDAWSRLSSPDQAPCSPDATALPHRPRCGDSRAGEQTLLPLAVGPMAMSLEPEPGSRAAAAVTEERPSRPPADALADRLGQLGPRSGKNVLPIDATSGASALSRTLPHGSGAAEGHPTQRLHQPPDGLVPCPPAVQKTANRGPSVARRRGLQRQMDRVEIPS